VDLTPRHELEDVDEIRRGLLRGRRTRVLLVTAVLVVVGGFVLVQGLRNATLFFRNVDEAIEQREDLGDKRFRIQGRVIPATVTNDGGVTTFQIVHDCEVAAVRHLTDPPDLFESPWIPVVLEGAWEPGSSSTIAGSDSHFFLSDRMLVKHTNEYEAVSEESIQATLPEGYFDGCPDGFAEAAERGRAS